MLLINESRESARYGLPRERFSPLTQSRPFREQSKSVISIAGSFIVSHDCFNTVSTGLVDSPRSMSVRR